jgi:hypothetical protein
MTESLLLSLRLGLAVIYTARAPHTKPPPPYPYLDGLPPEVTEHIARFLEGEHRGWGLDDFRALRLTCKDIYLKTFRLYGVTYFTEVSVAFTTISLRRLRDIATHNNSFGLSLSTFPKDLKCSTYRLPSGVTVRRQLLQARGSESCPATKAVVKAISLACWAGSDQPAIAGPYSPRIQAIVRKYSKALMEQRSLEASGLDIRSLGENMAALPNLKAVTCTVQIEGWGQPDWLAIAGLPKAAFQSVEHTAVGTSNLTLATTKVMCDIGHASAIRRLQGRQLYLDHLEFRGDVEKEGRVDGRGVGCPQNVALHRIDVSAYAEPLKEALSQLKILYMDIDPCNNVGDVVKNTKALLRILFSSNEMKELCVDLYDTYYDAVGPARSADTLGTIMEMQRCTCLASLEIYGADIEHRMHDIVQLILMNATSLIELQISAVNDPNCVESCRDVWRPALRAASQCTALSEFILGVYSDVVESSIDISCKRRGAVAALLATLVVSPTEPGQKLGWIQ